MHGLWYERSWADLCREAAIHAVLSLLFVPAVQLRCAASTAIVALIGLQHLASLFVHPDGFLPPTVVLPGAAALAAIAFVRGSPLLLFAGIYSCVSKIELIRLLLSQHARASLASAADPINEILKLIAATALWSLFAYFLTYSFLERSVCTCLGCRPPRRRPPKWFSEFDCLVACCRPRWSVVEDWT